MLADMDANNVCLAIMSIVAPGVQGIENTTVAVNMATELNNELSASYGSGPNASRFRFFCNVPMQSPSAAVAEMTRCLALPGAVGVMIHGFSNIDNDTGVLFPDQGDGIESFWAAVEASGRPLYLHTRTPSTTQMEIYQNGYGMLSGSAYGFTDWGALELIRIMLAGIFDRYPQLNIIVGHAGEAIPSTLYRMDQRIRHFTRTWNATQTLQYYWEHNVIATMSGVQSQSTFNDLFRVTSSDRVMASCDYPFEDIFEIMGYFDTIDINFQVKQKMAFGNAQSWFSISNLVTPTASPATVASGTVTETVTVTATQVVTSTASATSPTTLKTTTSAPTSTTKSSTSSTTTTTTSATASPTTGTVSYNIVQMRR
jgi:2,3-dihydroxybenzoate decarboxylase